MKKRIISLALSAITAISAVSAMSASAWGGAEESVIEEKLGNCIKIEDFDWIKYQGNTGAKEPFAIYMSYGKETSSAVFYEISNMPDCISFNVDGEADLEQIKAIISSVDENLNFFANTGLSADNKRSCFAQSDEIAPETAKEIRELLGETAITFGYTSAMLKYQDFVSDYLTGYGYTNENKEEVKAKLEAFAAAKGIKGEIIEADFGDSTPSGGIANMSQTLFIPSDKLTAEEHLKLAKDIYNETGMQPLLWHHESLAKKELSKEINMTNYLNGDANCDNVQSMADAASIFQAIGNPDKYALSDLGEFNADYACDGLTPDDAIAIQKKLAGIE